MDERTLKTGMVYKRHSGWICQLYFSSEIFTEDRWSTNKVAMGPDDANFFRNPWNRTSQKNIFTINIVRIILTKLSNKHAWRNLNFLKKIKVPPRKHRSQQTHNIFCNIWEKGDPQY